MIIARTDGVFVESPETEDEFARIANAIDTPLVANMVEGGYSPMQSAERLNDLGFSVGLFPVSSLAAAAAAITSVYDTLRTTGRGPGSEEQLMPIPELHALMGMDDVNAFDERLGD